MAGLLGVGGGIVLVPAFFYAFAALGYASPALMRMCLATSLATIVVTSLRSVLAHRRRGAVDEALLRRWAPGIVVGAVLGVIAASQLGTQVLQAIFGGLGIAVGLLPRLRAARVGGLARRCPRAPRALPPQA